jgi:hypothetical protein
MISRAGFALPKNIYLPEPSETGLSGDVAIADSGLVWPMGNGPTTELTQALNNQGLSVNVLPEDRPLRAPGDVRNHKCLVGATA